MQLHLRRAVTLAALPVLALTLGTSSAMAQPAGGGPPPPKGFEADSASFVSATTGFVLGARHCSQLPCAARLVKTTDGGATWKAVPVPAVALVPTFSGTPSSAVSTVRFENSRDGWLFGPGLWATTNAGQSWQRVSLGGPVVALAARHGQVFAATTTVNGSLNNARLHESAVGSTKWTLVSGVSPANAITVSGHSVWAGIAPRLWHSADGGKHWTKLSFRCPSPNVTASAVAAASTENIALTCTDDGFPQPGSSVKVVYRSANGGSSFRPAASQPPESGQVRQIAMPPGHPGTIAITAASGASYIYRSANGGKTWRTTTYFDGGLDWRDLAFASATTGYLIHFSGGPVIAYGLGLLKTVNAGRTWQSVSIP